MTILLKSNKRWRYGATL